MKTEDMNSVGLAHRSPSPSTLSSATKPRTSRQRQIDELYDLYDMVIIERLLNRPSSPDRFSGG